MIKIGFASIGHTDYINKASADIAARAVSELISIGFDIYGIEGPIVDVTKAAKSGREFIKQDVEGIIIFLETWIECPVTMALIREIEHLPICLWGFPMFTRNGLMESTGSFVSYAMFKGTMDRIKYRYKPVLGLPDGSEALKQVESFCKAASAAERLKRTRIGLVGYTSMSIYPGTFDHVFLRIKIGPEVEHIDAYTLINLAESLPEQDSMEIIGYLKKIARMEDDVQYSDLVKVSKLYAALKKIIEQRGLHSINVKCQYEFSKEYGMVMCVPLSVLAEFGVVTSCEGDILNTVSMLMLNYLSGQTVTYGDVINLENDLIKFSSCGFLPYSFGDKHAIEIRKCIHPGFNGIQNSFTFKPGKVTVMRLVEDQCDFHIIYLTGQGLKTELRQGYMPALDVRPDGDVKRFVDNISGQHYAICYGDLSNEIEDLSRILGINVIRV